MAVIKEAYVGYLPTGETEKMGVKLSVLHPKLKPVNFNKLDYIRYAANAFSYIISLQVYWSNRYNKHVDRVIVSDNNLSDNIGCNVKHSSKILHQLKGIFGLEFNRLPERGGAREIIINERVIEFMKIYDEASLHEYIKKYKIDKQYFKAIQQVFRYRAWGVKDSQLAPSQIELKKKFLKRNQNFFHRAITNNKGDWQRIDFIKSNKELLSSLNISQLERIQEEKKEGKLSHYWNLILIKLEQKVSKLLRKTEVSEDQNEETNPSQVNSESNERPTAAHTRATAAAVKDPEDNEITAGDYLDIMIAFNNMITNQAIPEVKELSKNHLNAITHTVKYQGKENVLQAISKVSQLIHDKKYKHKITFERLMTPQQIEWINNKIEKVDVESDFLGSYLKQMGLESISSIDADSLPAVSSLEQVIKVYNELKQA